MMQAMDGPLVALFGGSFNPPHVGHVLAVSYVKSIFAVDRVMVVPVYRHAFGKELASFEHRLAMCRLAMEWLEGTEISDVERAVGGESRTLYTLEELRRREPGLRLRLVIGADVLPDLPKWHRFDRIAELAPPIVLGRVGFAHPDAPPPVLPAISSTEIRAHVRAGDLDALELMVPKSVRDYIREEDLYRS